MKMSKHPNTIILSYVNTKQTYPSIFLTKYKLRLSICTSIYNLFIYLSINLSIYSYIYLFIYLSIYLSIDLSKLSKQIYLSYIFHLNNQKLKDKHKLYRKQWYEFRKDKCKQSLPKRTSTPFKKEISILSHIANSVLKNKIQFFLKILKDIFRTFFIYVTKAVFIKGDQQKL